MRDKLYNTRERARQLLANENSDIPEETTFTNVEQVLSSQQSNTSNGIIAHESLHSNFDFFPCSFWSLLNCVTGHSVHVVTEQ